MAYWYRVTTETRAIIREAWMVRSHHPLTRAQLDALAACPHFEGATPGAIAVASLDDELRVDEDPRTVIDIATMPAHVLEGGWRH